MNGIPLPLFIFIAGSSNALCIWKWTILPEPNWYSRPCRLLLWGISVVSWTCYQLALPYSKYMRRSLFRIYFWPNSSSIIFLSYSMLLWIKQLSCTSFLIFQQFCAWKYSDPQEVKLVMLPRERMLLLSMVIWFFWNLCRSSCINVWPTNFFSFDLNELKLLNIKRLGKLARAIKREKINN